MTKSAEQTIVNIAPKQVEMILAKNMHQNVSLIIECHKFLVMI